MYYIEGGLASLVIFLVFIAILLEIWGINLSISVLLPKRARKLKLRRNIWIGVVVLIAVGYILSVLLMSHYDMWIPDPT